MKTAVYATHQTQIIGKSRLQTIEASLCEILKVHVLLNDIDSKVVVELRKLPNRSLGFSVAGGKGSTPAYEDVDEVSL